MATIENLTDKQLQEIASGRKLPTSIKPKYCQNDIVEDNRGFVLKIVQVAGWANAVSGYVYDSIIIEIPSNYTGSYSVGENCKITEIRIVAKR